MFPPVITPPGTVTELPLTGSVYVTAGSCAVVGALSLRVSVPWFVMTLPFPAQSRIWPLRSRVTVTPAGISSGPAPAGAVTSVP